MENPGSPEAKPKIKENSDSGKKIKEEHFATHETILTKSKFENLGPARNFWDFRQFKVPENPLESGNYIF